MEVLNAQKGKEKIMSRELSKVMLEGQKKTLEAMELMKKQVAGTITEAESTRLAMLNGNLLALAGQAADLGFDINAVINATQAAVDAPEVDLNEEYLEDEGLYEYEEDEDEGLDLFNEGNFPRGPVY